MEEFVRTFLCKGCVNEEKCKEYGVFCDDVKKIMKGEKKNG